MRTTTIDKLVRQIAAFGVVGAVAFIIDYTVMLALTEILGAPYIVSTTVGFTVSVVFNYTASMRYVFRRREETSRRREFIIFVALSVVGLGLNDIAMILSVDILGVDYRIAKIAVTAVVMVFNFVTRKMLLDAGDARTLSQL